MARPYTVTAPAEAAGHPIGIGDQNKEKGTIFRSGKREY